MSESKKVPVDEVAGLVIVPVVPLSPATPVSALSNLLRSRAGGPELVEVVEPGVDLRLVAGRTADQPAAERLGDLHPLDHRELAVVDHLARLGTGLSTIRKKPLPGPPAWASM